MTFIDAAAAVQEGAVPTNEQLIAFLTRLQATLPPQDKLSKSGSGLVFDALTFLEVIGAIIQERNGDEDLQEFLWRTRGAASQLGKDGLKFRWGKDAAEADGTKGTAKKDKKSAKDKARKVGTTIKNDTTQAGRHLRNLVRLFLVQPELRHIAADLGFVLAEVVDATASNTIAGARSELGQAQSSTGTFQSVAQKALAQARVEKANGTALSSGLTSRIVQMSQRGDATAGDLAASNLSASLLREQLAVMLKGGGLSLDAIRTELDNGRTVPALEELRTQALSVASSVSKNAEDLRSMQRDIENGEVPTRVLQALESEVNGNGRTTEAAKGDSSSAEQPQSTTAQADTLRATDLADALQLLFIANKQLQLQPKKEVLTKLARDTRKDAQKNLDAAFSEEVQQRLWKRSKKLIVDCQSQERYREAFLWLIGRIETLFKNVEKSAAWPGTSMNSALSEAAEPLLHLLSNFAGGQEIRPLLALLRELAVGARDIPEIQTFWRDVDGHTRRCLLEEGFVLTPDAEQGIKNLVDRFKKLTQDYKDKVAKLSSGLANFLDRLRHDELILKLIKVIGSLLRDIGKDGWKSSSLWHDLRSHILPAVFEKFGTIPVPRIKYLHPDFDLVIENIAIDLKSFLPDTFDIRMTNDVHFDFSHIKESTHAHSFKIKIKGMSLRVHKLAFAFTWRKGIKIRDEGIADLNVRNFGVSIYIDVPKDPGPHYFVVRKVNAKLGTLRIQVHKSNHRILHAFADRLANSYMTKRILRHFIAIGITLGLKQLDVALMARKLNKDSDEGQISLQEVRRQMAELRDLLRKYHEQAGTLEIDFTRPDTGENIGKLGSKKIVEAAGKSIEDSHAVRWIKRQVDETARKEIKRNRWRSNAFDMEGMESDWPEEVVEAVHEDEQEGNPEEGTLSALLQSKPEGPTDSAVVDNAEKELQSSIAEVKQERQELQSPEAMESAAGKAALNSSNDKSKQTRALENEVEKDLS